MEQLIDELTEKLKDLFEDDPVIALAGAHAKGTADENSDLDIYLFGNAPKSYEDRQKLINALCDPGSTPSLTQTLDQPWGGSADFTYHGIPVETVLRTMSQTEQIVSRCMEGDFTIIPQTWTSNGYYTYIYLSELSFVKPLHDPNGWLRQMKQKTEVFPAPLRQAIIHRFLRRAGTWIGNFHYASAVEREDILFLAPTVVHTVMDMIQVIFALNGRYFTGDKKLKAALQSMPYCPRPLLDNLELLLSFPEDKKALRQQAEVLHAVYEQLQERSLQIEY